MPPIKHDDAEEEVVVEVEVEVVVEKHGGSDVGGPDVAPCSLNDEPWKKYIVRLINFFLHFQFSLLATFAMIIMLHDHNDIGCHRVIFMI